MTTSGRAIKYNRRTGESELIDPKNVQFVDDKFGIRPGRALDKEVFQEGQEAACALPRASAKCSTSSARASTDIDLSGLRAGQKPRPKENQASRGCEPRLAVSHSIHFAGADDMAAVCPLRAAERRRKCCSPLRGGRGQPPPWSSCIWRTRGCRSRGRSHRHQQRASGRLLRRTGSAPPRHPGGSTLSRRPRPPRMLEQPHSIAMPDLLEVVGIVDACREEHPGPFARLTRAARAGCRGAGHPIHGRECRGTQPCTRRRTG